MQCVNRQKPHGSGRRVRGFASAPPAQNPSGSARTPWEKAPPRLWLETMRLLMGKPRPREEAMKVVLRNIHCESTMEAVLLQSFRHHLIFLGKVDRKMGFHPLVSLLIQTRLFHRLLLVPILLYWQGLIHAVILSPWRQGKGLSGFLVPSSQWN